MQSISHTNNMMNSMLNKVGAGDLNSESKYFEVQATFALNNLAVTMMEHGCFAQAFETLRDAVTVLQIATDSPNQEDCRLTIRTILRDAIDNACNLRAERCSIALRGLLHDDNVSELFDSSSYGKTSYTIIRIREEDSSLLEQGSLNLLTAIVLFNFAIASFCKVHCCCAMENKRESSRSAYEDAVTILHLAYALLEEAAVMHNVSLSEDAAHNAGAASTTAASAAASTYAFAFARGVSMTAVVLQTLQQSLEALGQKDEAFACVMRLTHIRNIASVLNDYNLSVESFAAAA